MKEQAPDGRGVARTPHTGRRRVLVVTFDFPPSLAVGAHACSQLTRHLPRYGWEPVVLAAQERHGVNIEPGARYAFPGTVLRTRVLPHPLNVWAAVRRRLNAWRGRVNGRSTEEAAFPPERQAGRMKRWVLSVLTIPDTKTGWLPVAVQAGLRAVRRYRVSGVLSSGPHWTNHLVGFGIAILARLPLIVYFRDPWMGIPQWKPVSRLSLAVEMALEEFVICRARRVVCVTENHRDMLCERYPKLPATKFITVPNGFDESEWTALPDHPGRGDKFVIAYVGSFYQARNPLPLFQALQKLIGENAVDEDELRVELIGWCDVAEGTRVRDAARETGLGGVVDFVGALPRKEALARMLRADLLLLLAEAQPYQIPGKTYEYLRAGQPILALTRAGAVADLLRGVPGTTVVDPADVGRLVTVLHQYLTGWRCGDEPQRPDASFVKRFDRMRLAGELASVLDATLAGDVARLPGVR
jgi:glycosyltransferase involved in cell wall biosynthesis